MTGYVATAEIDVDASTAQVWQALTDPEVVARYMWGTRVETDWSEGSAVVWRGVYEGKAYEDRGKVLEVAPGQRLVVTHWSPLSGTDDAPENYHTLTYMLGAGDGRTHLTLSQDGAATEEEAAHSAGMWASMLAGLKDVVEQG